MKIRRQFWLILLILILTAGLGSAEEVSSTEPVVIVVTGSLDPQETLTTPAIVETVSVSREEVETVVDLIEQVPGLEVQANRPTPGGTSTVHIWGSTAAQVLILLDGIPLNTAWDGLYDLSFLPLEAVDRIEVQKGSSSSLYGTAAVGGVVNIITKKGFQSNTEARVVLGSYEHEELAISSKGPVKDDLFYAFHLSSQQGDGYLEHSAYEDHSYFGSLSKDLSDYSNLSLSVIGHRAAIQLPAIPYSEADQSDNQVRFQSTYTYDNYEGLVKKISLWIDKNDRSYLDSWTHSRHEVTTYGYSGIQTNETEGLNFSLDGQLSQIKSTDVNGEKGIATHGITLEKQLGLGSRRNLGLSGRLDLHSFFGLNFSPKVGLSQKLSGGTWKVNFGSAFRAPTATELFWEPGGDPNLKPERSWSLETQLLPVKTGALDWQVSAFYRQVQDMINWAPDDPNNLFGLWSIQNIDQVSIKGVELAASSKITDKLSLSGSFTALDAQGSKQAVNPLSPVEYKVSARYGFSPNLEGNLKIRGATERYNGVPSFAIVDAGLAWDVSSSAQIDLRVSNLFDEEYQLNAGYPMPGREFRAGARYSF